MTDELDGLAHLVKPLEWERSNMLVWNEDYHTVPANYMVRCAGDRRWEWRGGIFGSGYEKTPEMAKAAAFIHWSRRILSALNPDAIEALRSAPDVGWQPIETAPKDGSMILVCLPRMMNLIVRARFSTVHKHFLHDYEGEGGISRAAFFHEGDLWQPMPEPPCALADQTKEAGDEDR